MTEVMIPPSGGFGTSGFPVGDVLCSASCRAFMSLIVAAPGHCRALIAAVGDAVPLRIGEQDEGDGNHHDRQ